MSALNSALAALRAQNAQRTAAPQTGASASAAALQLVELRSTKRDGESIARVHPYTDGSGRVVYFLGYATFRLLDASGGSWSMRGAQVSLLDARGNEPRFRVEFPGDVIEDTRPGAQRDQRNMECVHPNDAVTRQRVNELVANDPRVLAVVDHLDQGVQAAPQPAAKAIDEAALRAALGDQAFEALAAEIAARLANA